MTKHDLRKQFKERRKALTALEVAEQSEAIAQRFFGFFDVSQMATIHSYLPIESQNEVNTFCILNFIHNHFPDTQIVVPKVIPNTSNLEHFVWQPEIQLTQNHWNIPEPSAFISYQLSVINKRLINDSNVQNLTSNLKLVIVPLLAYDQIGNRVGYGKGFYDRFLAQYSTNVIKVGLSFFEPVELIEDTNVHDVQLNYCVTPNKVWVF